jgi:DNA-binding IclR family transcriptional regulator
MTGETVTDAGVLAEQLAHTRQTGIATEIEEAVLGECVAAAVVFDSSAEAIGAIGLVVPTARWPLEPADVDALRDTARTVSRELGAPVWPPRR